MNDTPQGDGNFIIKLVIYISLIRMNDTPQGDGNKSKNVASLS